MARARVRDEIAARVDAVWACLEDFGDLSAWAPGDPEVELEGSGVGAVRTVIVGGLPQVRERLTAHDGDRKRFAYEIVEGPFPFTGYAAQVELTALPGDRTAIDWSSTFEPAGGMGANDVVAMIEQMYRGFIAKLKETLAAG